MQKHMDCVVSAWCVSVPQLLCRVCSAGHLEGAGHTFFGLENRSLSHLVSCHGFVKKHALVRGVHFDVLCSAGKVHLGCALGSSGHETGFRPPTTSESSTQLKNNPSPRLLVIQFHG